MQLIVQPYYRRIQTSSTGAHNLTMTRVQMFHCWQINASSITFSILNHLKDREGWRFQDILPDGPGCSHTVDRHNGGSKQSISLLIISRQTDARLIKWVTCVCAYLNIWGNLKQRERTEDQLLAGFFNLRRVTSQSTRTLLPCAVKDKHLTHMESSIDPLHHMLMNFWTFDK